MLNTDVISADRANSARQETLKEGRNGPVGALKEQAVSFAARV